MCAGQGPRVRSRVQRRLQGGGALRVLPGDHTGVRQGGARCEHHVHDVRVAQAVHRRGHRAALRRLRLID